MEILEKAGLSNGEGKVYAVLLDGGSLSLQEIHERAGIERRNVYDTINKLINKGLVSYYEENRRKVYKLTHPKNLLEFLGRQGHEIEERKAAVESELPKMAAQYSQAKAKVNVQAYRGKDGIKALFNEMLDYPDHYFIGGNWGMRKYVGEEWWRLWNSKREKRKIRWHDILTKRMFAAQPAKLEYYEKKVLPPEFDSPNVILVFGDRVVNLFWVEPPFAFEIQNAEISRNYLGYFRYLWKRI